MKSDVTTTVLNWVLAASLVLSAIFAIQFFFRTREIRRLQAQEIRCQNNRAIVTALVNEAVRYSERNPAIDPILVSVGAKPGKSAGAGTAKPAGK